METAQQVTIEGDATRTVIITGDGNQVSLSAQGEFAYHPLDEDFRTMQGSRTPADFLTFTMARAPIGRILQHNTTPLVACLTICLNSLPTLSCLLNA